MAGQSQRNEVKEQVQKLLASSQIVYGSLDSVEVVDADANKGAFMSPILLMNEKPFTATAAHDVEAFGPVSTIMPYKNLDEAIVLSKLGNWLYFKFSDRDRQVPADVETNEAAQNRGPFST